MYERYDRGMERAVHDRGGWPDATPIDRTEHELADWEILMDAVVSVLARRGAMNVDEMRRGIESMPRAQYEAASYYERWLYATETILGEKGHVGRVDARYWNADRSGDSVRVVDRPASAITERLVISRESEAVAGVHRRLTNPGRTPTRRRTATCPSLPRRVRAQRGLPLGKQRLGSRVRRRLRALVRAGVVSDHEHDHTHAHDPIGRVGEPPTAARVRALEQVLVEKGVITREEVRARVDWLVSRTPAHGARLVARAWTDEAFKERLLADARVAALELGLDPGESPQVVALENTENVHHMVVCTLCSCYPKALLGPPPDWYKSLPYRSRAVSDPRGVLREFGLTLDDDVEVHVVDSTAEIRDPRRAAASREDGVARRGCARRSRHARLHDRRRTTRTGRATP